VEGFVFLGTQLAAFASSQIERETIEAYLATEYRVGAPSPFRLVIGQRHPDLAALLDRTRATCAAVLTAWNPYSELRSRAANDEAQQALVADLDRRHLIHFQACGVDPTGKWAPEESRLILDIDLALTGQLCARFRQNGAVWAKSDAMPMLLLSR
jgi:hypothetical protein